MATDKKYFFWQNLKDFFTISDKDLKEWKKKNYETRQQMQLTTRQEDEEYERKNSRD